jgi:hypothetical protein
MSNEPVPDDPAIVADDEVGTALLELGINVDTSCMDVDQGNLTFKKVTIG